MTRCSTLLNGNSNAEEKGPGCDMVQFTLLETSSSSGGKIGGSGLSAERQPEALLEVCIIGVHRVITFI